jgi:hypothetical protein
MCSVSQKGKIEMSAGPWLGEDIQNILLSLNLSSAMTARWAGTPQMAVYRQGYQEALVAVALACGLSPNSIGTDPVMVPVSHPMLFLDDSDDSPGEF